MRLFLAALSFLIPVCAQTIDSNVAREVAAVRAELVRSHAELLKYIWKEETDVLVGGKLKSSTAARCGYGGNGDIIRQPIGPEPEKPGSKQTSNRPLVRSRGAMQDYIERSISRIREYAPPNPAVIDRLVNSGEASLGSASGGTSDVRMTNYFVPGDSVVFTYDSASKRLLRVAVSSNLGPKDPITLEAVFDLLPGNVNHLASAMLKAPSKKVQVNVKNLDYQKQAD